MTITKISVGDNVVVKYNTPKVCQVVKIHQYDNNEDWVSDDVKTITIKQAQTYRFHIECIILCNAETGTKLNRKQTYNAASAECLSEYLDSKRALITKLEKLIT